MAHHSTGRRLKAARALGGFDNVTDFAAEIAFPGLAARNIRKVEADERDLGEREIEAIAKACELPVEFFTEPFSVMSLAPERRAQGVTPIVGVREAAEAAFAELGKVRGVHELASHPGVYEVNIEPPIPDDIPFGGPENFVRTFRWEPAGASASPQDLREEVRELAEAVASLASGNAEAALAAAREAAARLRPGTAPSADAPDQNPERREDDAQ